MHCTFEKLNSEHRDDVIDIFNYYIRTTTAAYRDEMVEKAIFHNFMEVAEDYPAYAIKDDINKIIGFCMLKPHKALPVFSETAELMYFIHHEYTGKGIGLTILKRLEVDARKKGVTKLLANISSENSASLKFHKKNGFVECGRFNNVGKKFNRYFSIVWMQKELTK